MSTNIDLIQPDLPQTVIGPVISGNVEPEELKEMLYTKYVDGKPVAYAYGEEWVAMALYMDDMQYKTPEEAKEAWERWKRIKEGMSK